MTRASILALVALTWFASVAYGAAAQGSANVGQSDLGTWPCPLSTYQAPPIFTNMPLGVSLTTTGGLVLMSLAMTTITAGTQSDLALDLTVDGQPVGAEMRWTFVYDPALSSLTRVVFVSAGLHTFSARLACISAGDLMSVTRAWLSAYELPLIKK